MAGVPTTSEAPRLRVCFISLKAYDLLAGAARPRYVGGAERQQVMIARALASRGHRVSFVTLDYGQPDGIDHQGIRVFKAYAVDRGVPGLRFLHPRWTGLAGALSRAGAEVYYQMGADSETGQIAAWCRWRDRKFVFATASDSDCDPLLPRLPQRRRRWLYRYGIRAAACVVTQTQAQERLLREGFGVRSVVINSGTPDPGWSQDIARQRSSRPQPRLLWVGRFAPVKRLELLLDLAASRPAWEFHVAGDGPADDPYVQALKARGRTLPNVTLHGLLGDRELHEEYLQAHALVCTSSWEGVPNTFMEAWARGLPVVSTIDPDGIVAKHGLGAAATPEDLPAAIEKVLGTPAADFGPRVRSHFLRHYSLSACVDANERLFQEVANKSRVGQEKSAPQPRL